MDLNSNMQDLGDPGEAKVSTYPVIPQKLIREQSMEIEARGSGI